MNSIIETCPSSKHLLTRIKEGACHTSRPAAGLALGGVWQKDTDALSKSLKILKASQSQYKTFKRRGRFRIFKSTSAKTTTCQWQVQDIWNAEFTMAPWRHGTTDKMRLLRLLGHGRNSSSCCLSSGQDLRSAWSAATSRNVLNVYNISIIQNRSYIKDIKRSDTFRYHWPGLRPWLQSGCDCLHLRKETTTCCILTAAPKTCPCLDARRSTNATW